MLKQQKEFQDNDSNSSHSQRSTVAEAGKGIKVFGP